MTDNTEKLEGLKPCPHCGGAATGARLAGSAWFIDCDHDSDCISADFQRTEAEAITAWNTRPDAPAPDAGWLDEAALLEKAARYLALKVNGHMDADAPLWVNDTQSERPVWSFYVENAREVIALARQSPRPVALDPAVVERVRFASRPDVFHDRYGANSDVVVRREDLRAILAALGSGSKEGLGSDLSKSDRLSGSLIGGAGG